MAESKNPTARARDTVGPMAGLDAIEHIVVVMLENRSLDHLLGFLYTEAGNTSPAGDAYDGLTGMESCPDASGNPITVSRITATTPNAYFMPGANPGEGYANTNAQLFGASGASGAPASGAPAAGATPPMNGFVVNFAEAISHDGEVGKYVFPGTEAPMIMRCFDPSMVPVLSGLARGFAVCDRWFASAPTMTMPNRAFAGAGTSDGRMDDAIKTFDVPSIYGLLGRHGLTWKIYGYETPPLTAEDFPDTANAPADNIGLFGQFQADAAAGTLPAYAFVEPDWSATGNSQHPNYNVALGEQVLLDAYRAVRDSPAWASTLLIVTYDEHGGCYDHVPPPWGATPPDATPGEFGFDFTRLGLRVPTVIVSAWTPAGTVFRVPDGTTPLDHTSILATIEHRWSLPALTRRDAAAPNVSGALSLTTARTDDPLAGVSAPTPPANPPGLVAEVSHLETVRHGLATS
jgi:phospholipase C